MTTYQVHANSTVFGTWEATSEQEARDLCAQEAGYRDESDMEAQTGKPSELVAHEVRTV